MTVLVEVSGHKIEPPQTRDFVWFSTLSFSVLQNAFQEKTDFFCFANFFVWSLKTRAENGFLYNPPIEEAAEHKTRVFSQLHVQEFHLWFWTRIQILPKTLDPMDPDYNYIHAGS
jgi:hypothetical protein